MLGLYRRKNRYMRLGGYVRLLRVMNQAGFQSRPGDPTGAPRPKGRLAARTGSCQASVRLKAHPGHFVQ
jgi:hypothetical protein